MFNASKTPTSSANKLLTGPLSHQRFCTHRLSIFAKCHRACPYTGAESILTLGLITILALTVLTWLENNLSAPFG